MTKVLEAALAQEVGFAPRRGWEGDLRRAIASVAGRHRVAGLPELIASDAALVREVAENIAVGESYFFRQPAQLEMAVAHLEEQANAGRQPVLWSAGCSRGEELFSMLASLWERQATGGNVRAFGTDLCGESVRQARLGVYGDWSLRTLEREFIERYFDHLGAGKFRVKRRLSEHASFNHRTIQQELCWIEPGSIDVILFRNVGIYLTDAALNEILRGMCAALRPGGRLFLAPTDPVPTPEQCPELVRVDVGVYQRQSSHSGAYRRLELESTSTPPERVSTMRRAPEPHRAALQAATAEAADVVRLAYEDADAGLLSRAISRLDELLTDSPNDVGARLARGHVLLAAEHYKRALADFRHCAGGNTLRHARVEFFSTETIASYYCTICLSALSEYKLAGSELKQLEQVLLQADPQASLNGACRVADLLDAVRSDLRRLL